MLINCIGCGAKLHTDDTLREGSIEMKCTECSVRMEITTSVMEDDSNASAKASGLLQDVEKGMDIDKAITLYLGD